MKNTFTAFFLGIAAFAAVVSFAQVGRALEASTAVSAGLTVPAGYTVVPPNDNDRGDDQIIQLNNLTIQSVSGQLPGVIYASNDAELSTCREYMDVNGAGAKLLPCPLAPSILYQISVGKDAILLLKDRARASINDFAVGDHINVFGFLDRGTSGVQALIVRDLDKPAPSAQYVQLNDLTALSTPSPSSLPATFQAARIGIEPCFSFASLASPRAVRFPCPIGFDISTSAAALTAPNAALYRPFRQYYNIQISTATQALDAARRPANPWDIQAGDHLNVYGRYIPGTRLIEALILRDLSLPRSAAGQANLIVILTDNRIVCITTPCGQIDGMTVSVHFLDNEADDTPTLVASQVSVKGQASFTGLKPGRYVVTASGNGYAAVGRQIVLAAGETGKVSLLTSTVSDSAGAKISLLSPNGGESLRRGSVVTIHWQIDGSVAPASASLADIFLIAPNGNTYTIARAAGQASGKLTMKYDWTVPATLEKILLGDGGYSVKVCFAGTSACDMSDAPFNVTSAPLVSPSIASISPAQGAAGTTVTVRGSGFTPYGNYVYLGAYQVTGRGYPEKSAALTMNGYAVASGDGTTLTFTVPEYVSPCPYNPYEPGEPRICATVALQLKPGVYPVHVVTEGGSSNSVNFTVTSAVPVQ